MDKFEPMVSIIIPVYNGANYMREAIDSALDQTYKNIEILVVNDGSADNTEEIALSYGDKIRYFAKENGGTSTALNIGIANMRGEYFSWLSHDDMYYPDKIKVQIEYLSKLSNKNTIMMTDLDGIDENYKKIYQTDYIQHIKQYPPRENSNIHPIIYNQTHGCTLLIPKKCFDVVGLFDEKELVAQDFEFFYRAFLVFPHKLIPKILVTARDSSNRQGRRSKKKGDEEYSKLYIKMIENLTDEDINLLAPNRGDFYMDMYYFFRDAEYSIALEYISSKMLKSLQISSYDLIGRRFNGHDLHFYLNECGNASKQLVLFKHSDDKDTFVFDFDALHASKNLLHQKIFLDAALVHLHLVHNIIDINYLPFITKLKPTVITLHDPFFLGGHCVHHFDCVKWQTHCADCLNINRIFAIDRDISALNFALKKAAIQNSKIAAIVASNWMKNKVEKSPIWQGKKIYYLPFGIDQNFFKPGDSSLMKNNLNIPMEHTVLMFRGDDDSGFKGLDIIIDALNNLKYTQNITLLAVGKKGELDSLKHNFNVIEYEWINNDEKMVSLYQACDIFLMPSRQETFGMMAIEAMSCGKMVLSIEGEGTALPEIINSPACGLSVKESDFASELERLLDSKFEILDRGNRCADYARVVYSKDKYVKGMVSIYHEIVNNHIYSEEESSLLEQLKKYARDDYIKFENTKSVQIEAQIQKIVSKHRTLKRLVRFGARSVWKLIAIFRLRSFVQSSALYKRLERRGIVGKLRG